MGLFAIVSKPDPPVIMLCPDLNHGLSRFSSIGSITLVVRLNLGNTNNKSFQFFSYKTPSMQIRDS